MNYEPLPIDSEPDLLAHVKAGGREAFSAVVSVYGFRVHTVAWRILQDDARAADVVQETFLELFRCAARIETNLGGWLYRVASRRALDVLRSDRARKRREEAYQRQLQLRGPVPMQTLVHEAMLRLSDELRDILRDRYLERKTRARIAAERRLSESTVSRRLLEGLQEIRRILREEGAAIGLAPLHLLLAQDGHHIPAWVAKISSALLAWKAGVVRTCEQVAGGLWATAYRILRSTAVKTGAAGLFATLALVHFAAELRTFVALEKQRLPLSGFFPSAHDGQAVQQVQSAAPSQLPGVSIGPAYAGSVPGPPTLVTNLGANAPSTLAASIPLTMPTPERLAYIEAQRRVQGSSQARLNYLRSPMQRIITTNGDRLLVKGGIVLSSNGIALAPAAMAGTLNVGFTGTNVIETRSTVRHY